jgi:integrase
MPHQRREKNGLPKFCSWNVDRHGVRRVRFRRHGFSTYLTGTPWSPEFMQQHAAAIDGVKAQQTVELGSDRTLAGSIDALCVSYFRSPEYLNLTRSTQNQRRSIIERFRAEHGRKPVKGLQREHIKRLLGAMSATPESANHLLKCLRALLACAADLGWISTNLAKDIKRYSNKSDGYHTWTEEEIERFQERHPIGTKAGLAPALGLYTAQRKSDVIRMGWQHIRGDAIEVRQEKTATPLMLPLHPELSAVLASIPRTNLTFLVTEYGAPFTAGGFGNWFRDQCNAAGLPQCTFHGLRKAAATRLADAGCTTHEIAAVTGHKSLREVERYTKAANQLRLAQQALQVQLKAETAVPNSGPKGEHGLSNLVPGLDKAAKNS